MDALMTRSLEQRRDALVKANEIRTYRARLKKNVKAGRESPAFFFDHGPHEPLLRSMLLHEALRSMPGIRKKKADRILARAGISPSKTLGGVTDAQWRRLYAVLESYPTILRRLDIR